MSIVRISKFNKDSLVFGDAVENKFGSSKIMLTTSNGEPLLFHLKKCFSFGIDDKYKSYTISISLRDHPEFVELFELIEKECASHVKKPSENVMKCLYRKGKNPTLYLKITNETELYDENDEVVKDYTLYKNKHFHLNAVVKVESIFLSREVTAIQVKLYEGSVIKNKTRKRITTAELDGGGLYSR